MQIVDTRPPQAKQENRIFRAIGCTAVYLTSAGALCSMAGLGRTLLGAWGAGTVLLLALCFLPKQAKIQSIVRLSLFLLLGAAVRFLWEPSRDGVCLFVNRLFAASELQQAYLYEKLPVYAPQAEQTGCLQTAAILFGLLLAQLLTLPSRFSRTFVLAALCGAMAYLGVLPERGWLIALAGCLLLTLLPQDGGLRPWRLLPIAAVFVLLAAGCLLLPETENAQLSAWEERARDQLAVQTAAYGELPAQQDVPAEQTPQSEPPTFRQESMQSTLDGDRETAFPSHSRGVGDFSVAADAFCAIRLSGSAEKEAGTKPGRTFGRGRARVYLCQLPLCAALAAACRARAGKCAVRKLFGENRNDFGT